MTMTLAFRHLPPELRAAKEALTAARDEAMPSEQSRRARLALYLLLLAIGCGLGLGLVSSGIVTSEDKDLWRAGLTAVAILSGFMVATMVFTGKIEAAKSLSLSELRDVTFKVNYLLLYQIGTLANHLVCLMLMLFIPAVAARWPSAFVPLAVPCLGLFFVSISRSILIPLQILELHRFTHAAMLREKRDEAKKATEPL